MLLGASTQVESTVAAPAQSGPSLRDYIPDGLEQRAFVLEHFQWLGLLVLLGLAWMLARVVRGLARRLIQRLSSIGRLQVDRELLEGFELPLGIASMAIAFGAGLSLLELASGPERVLKVAAATVKVIALVWAMYQLVDVATWKLEQKAQATASSFDDMLVPLLRRTLKCVVLGIGLLYVASWISGDVWHVLAGLSIGSLAVGFAAKDSIENLFGTFTVLLDRPFGLGDLVRFEGIEGTVERVGFRSTKLRSVEDIQVTIPNSKFIGGIVENLGQRRWRRTRLVLSLTYDTPGERIETFCDGVRQLIREQPTTKKDDFAVWFAEFAASSLDVNALCSFEVTDLATENRDKHRLQLAILDLAKRLGVEFAFPTRSVYLHAAGAGATGAGATGTAPTDRSSTP